MALPTAFMAELKARLPLHTIVGRRVRLIRNGRTYKACCPFHQEKTPSFHVYDDHYHCYGCGAHGDVLSFEMAAAGLTFREALEALAAEAGLEVPKPDPATQAREARAASLGEVVEAACAFYEQRLRLPEGRGALDYLHRRGLDEATIARFRLGYAPGGNALRAHLRREGIEDDVLVEAGLAGRPEEADRAPYDTLRDRVVFPIRSRRGAVVSFGGRVLGDGRPKYLNGPETELFRKSRLLYGLHEAREAIAESGRVAVVEGYMDVIALASAGLPAAVAPLGTALTPAQIEVLWAHVAEPVLCFDGDEAGRRAAARALERALPMLGPGRSLRFAMLPAGQDPDDLIRERGPEALGQVLEAASPMVEACWQTLRARHRLDTPERRAALERDIDRLVQGIDDRSVAQQYRGTLRDRFWAEVRAARGVGGPRAGQGRGRGPGPSGTGVSPLGAVPAGPVPVRRVQEGVLLATVITHPEILDRVAERLGALAFDDAALADLRAAVLRAYDAVLEDGEVLDRDGLVNHLKAAGQGAAVDRVLGPAVCMHASFARPGSGTGEALAGWDHVFALMGREALDLDLRAAEDRLAAEMTEDSLARVHALTAGRVRLLDSPGPGVFSTTVDDGTEAEDGGSGR